MSAEACATALVRVTLLWLGRMFPDRQAEKTGEAVETAASGTRDLQAGTSGGRSNGGRSSVWPPSFEPPTVH